MVAVVVSQSSSLLIIMCDDSVVACAVATSRFIAPPAAYGEYRTDRRLLELFRIERDRLKPVLGGDKDASRSVLISIVVTAVARLGDGGHCDSVACFESSSSSGSCFTDDSGKTI